MNKLLLLIVAMLLSACDTGVEYRVTSATKKGQIVYLEAERCRFSAFCKTGAYVTEDGRKFYVYPEGTFVGYTDSRNLKEAFAGYVYSQAIDDRL